MKLLNVAGGFFVGVLIAWIATAFYIIWETAREEHWYPKGGMIGDPGSR